ncbi:hypothetical protein [Wolbachia endosymbiont (group B) of Erebia ligea]|uniref:hypothetical protein n=1 Tax=Wolbachia endosymbiont (group B) of Erebia ligea TaxID=2954010 RepID=UPI0021F8F1D9|nr:hypothetical protein [Wolbachia endosymbiont (group B) of Erebia ligea]
MASLTFKDSAGANVVSPTIKSIIYEDAAQNKYTFGVDNTSVFNTFRYEPNGAAEIDYSATATNFMTGGAIATLLGIGTNVDSIKTKTDSIPADLSADLVTIKTQVGTDMISGIKAKTDKITDTLGADVTAIKAKTDTIPADLTAKVTAIETATNAANLGDKITAIQTKTDKMPDDLGTELGKLAKTAELAPLAKTAELAPLAKTAELAPLAKTADVTAIRAKTDKMPDDLGTELGKLAKSAELAPLAKTADVTAIKAKTDTIPADLTAKVTAIETATNAANLGNKVTAIQTKTDNITDTLGADVTAIKAKTEFIPDTFTADVAAIKDATNAANLGNKVTAIQTKTDNITDTLGADVTAIKAKTDKMPAELIIKLTTIAETLNGSPKAAAAAKAVLESSFKKAIEEAGEDGSEWLKNEIKEIVSQPSFETPKDSSEALSWDW